MRTRFASRRALPNRQPRALPRRGGGRGSARTGASYHPARRVGSASPRSRLGPHLPRPTHGPPPCQPRGVSRFEASRGLERNFDRSIARAAGLPVVSSLPEPPHGVSALPRREPAELRRRDALLAAAERRRTARTHGRAGEAQRTSEPWAHVRPSAGSAGTRAVRARTPRARAAAPLARSCQGPVESATVDIRTREAAEALAGCPCRK